MKQLTPRSLIRLICAQALSLVIFPMGAAVAQSASSVCVSQEQNPGAGDFAFLGVIDTFDRSAESAAAVYSYSNPLPASYSGSPPPAISDTSQLFVTDTNDGPGASLFLVHDQPNDGTGGLADMTLDVAGDTAAVLVEDDPGEAVTNVGGLGTQFLADHGWVGCCTDGFVIGTLEGAWQVDAQFTLLVGIPQWQATSADGSSIPLVPDLNRRARLSALSACDRDNDGVSNDVDFCPDNTELDESVPTSGALNPNHWALTDGDGVFDTVLKGKGKGPNRSYTIEDTAGCSCEQIIEIQGLGAGHSKHGCSISAMDDWLDFVNP